MSTTNMEAIRETLDYDKNTNQGAYSLTKKLVKKWNDEAPEEVKPYTPLDGEAIGAVKGTIDELKMWLEKKHNGLVTLASKIKKITVTQITVGAINDAVVIEDVIKSYNGMATLFVSPANTPQTRMVIQNIANKLESRATTIWNDFRDVLNEMYHVAAFQLYCPSWYALTTYTI